MKKLLFLFFVVLLSCNSSEKTLNQTHQLKANKIESFLNSLNKATAYSGSILVAQNDTIIIAEGFGFANRETKTLNTKETKFKVGSITKTFTAVAILQLQEKGKLSIEDSLSKFLPDFPNSDKIQIKHLLTHSAGLPQNWREDWHEKRKLDFDEILNKIAQKELKFEPGQGEEYSNCGYALLAKIIEKSSGLNYADYCQENIFNIADMTNTGAVYNPEKEYENLAIGYEFKADKDSVNSNLIAEFLYTPNLKGQASAYTTVIDLYKYDRALKNHKLLNETSVKTLLSTIENSAYTLGNWLNVKTKNNGVLSYFSGVSNGYEAVMYRYIDKNTTIIALNNHQNTNIFNVSRTLSRIVNNVEYYTPTQRTSVELNTDDYQNLAGTYEFIEDAKDIFEISIAGNRIFIQSHGDPKEELFLEAQNKFFSKNYDLQINFSNPEEVIWTYNGEGSKYKLRTE